ncbi:MAG: DUF2780 domain-containing protein [Verrucomicrobia bacterium]|nr:DUF2780 domain-containing protein [Verrucomicrobiota bacterium]
MELIDTLTKQLGITEEQAKGGSGLLFKLAKEKLGGEDFGKVTSAIPDVGALISSVPKAGGLGGLVGGLTSSLGGSAGKLGDLAGLAGGFSKLGLDSGMVGKLVPLILSFAQSKGGDAVKQILAKVLK